MVDTEKGPDIVLLYLAEIDTNPVNETQAAKIIGLENTSALCSWRRNGLLNPMIERSSRKVLYDSKLVKRAFAIMIMLESGLKNREVRQALTGITRVEVEIGKNIDKFTYNLIKYFNSNK